MAKKAKLDEQAAAAGGTAAKAGVTPLRLTGAMIPPPVSSSSDSDSPPWRLPGASSSAGQQRELLPSEFAAPAPKCGGPAPMPAPGQHPGAVLKRWDGAQTTVMTPNDEGQAPWKQYKHRNFGGSSSDESES